MSALRVAFFADSYEEVNGVAHTCRTLTSVAQARQNPFFVVYGGAETSFVTEGSITRCQLRRGSASFAVDRNFRYDLLFYRHHEEIERRLRAFAPDIVHITGPGDAGTLGLVMSRKLGVPLCASWHTNLHEYAGRRLEKVIPFVPGLGRAAEGGSMQALSYFYRAADAVLAPNQELLDMLAASGAGPGFPMRRGVDSVLFTPARRKRQDNSVVIGYTGRLTVEKNVGFLQEIAAAMPDARMVIVGDGEEKVRLQTALPNAELPGVLRGEALADAYAAMDIFVFPSRTDTFGNAVLEALASGVPAVVTADGGPKYIVRSGETGFIAQTDAAFLRCVVELAENRTLARRMGLAARRQAMQCSWDSVWGEMETAWHAACARRRKVPA